MLGGIVTFVALLVLPALMLASDLQMTQTREPAQTPRGEPQGAVPIVHPDHPHARALLENALRYVAPENRMSDQQSGYPYEGWNQDPSRGLFLRSFTQLTAIGQWMEVFANVAAGYAELPYLSRSEALSHLALMTRSLRHDQQDPQTSAQGLLVNFLDLASGRRQGPLASDVDKQRFLDAFGGDKGEAIWNALTATGWIAVRKNGREADIQRGARYGSDYFDGPLAPYSDAATKRQVMAILDQRVALVIFGDNANLSASVAKTLGALLGPALKDNPQAIQLRQELEQFLARQQQGYAHLYDPQIGLFYFGWDAVRNRLFGWEDLQGNWTTGHMDYLVNEFRGPATFVVLRFGLPIEAIKNLGFKLKPYRSARQERGATAGRQAADIYALAPWEGSAFQALGLSLSMLELENPSWRKLLENVVAIELDFAQRQQLPGFLSESYTGEGTQYTDHVGIPELTVSPRSRITDAASLYTLGVAYSIAPPGIEEFLAANWPLVSQLFTDHGPWEGFNVARGQAIQFQTSAHTLSLILGLLGTSSEHMQRYLDAAGLLPRLAEIYVVGQHADLLAESMRVFAWADKASVVQSRREKTGFQVQGDRVNGLGIAFVSTRPEGVNLSGGALRLRYRCAWPLESVVVAFKPGERLAAGLIPQELFTRFADTSGEEAEIQVPLPATPGLQGIKEVVITHQSPRPQPVDLSITGFTFTPFAP
jgi:hypothetical protein